MSNTRKALEKKLPKLPAKIDMADIHDKKRGMLLTPEEIMVANELFRIINENKEPKNWITHLGKDEWEKYGAKAATNVAQAKGFTDQQDIQKFALQYARKPRHPIKLFQDSVRPDLYNMQAIYFGTKHPKEHPNKIAGKGAYGAVSYSQYLGVYQNKPATEYSALSDSKMGEISVVKKIDLAARADRRRELNLEEANSEHQILIQLKQGKGIKIETTTGKDKVLIGMELAQGINIRQLVHASTVNKSAYEWFNIAISIVDAVDRYHQKEKLLHRDLKPANIFFDPATNIAHLIDHGTATELGEVPKIFTNGTPGYAPREMSEGYRRDFGKKEAMAGTDVHALGMTLGEVFGLCRITGIPGEEYIALIEEHELATYPRANKIPDLEVRAQVYSLVKKMTDAFLEDRPTLEESRKVLLELQNNYLEIFSKINKIALLDAEEFIQAHSADREAMISALQDNVDKIIIVDAKADRDATDYMEMNRQLEVVGIQPDSRMFTGDGLARKVDIIDDAIAQMELESNADVNSYFHITSHLEKTPRKCSSIAPNDPALADKVQQALHARAIANNEYEHIIKPTLIKQIKVTLKPGLIEELNRLKQMTGIKKLKLTRTNRIKILESAIAMLDSSIKDGRLTHGSLMEILSNTQTSLNKLRIFTKSHSEKAIEVLIAQHSARVDSQPKQNIIGPSPPPGYQNPPKRPFGPMRENSNSFWSSQQSKQPLEEKINFRRQSRRSRSGDRNI